MQAQKPSKDELKKLIFALINEETNSAADSKDINSLISMQHLGVSSIGALTIMGEIENRLNLTLPETLLWDCKNVQELVDMIDANFDKYKRK